MLACLYCRPADSIAVRNGSDGPAPNGNERAKTTTGRLSIVVVVHVFWHSKTPHYPARPPAEPYCSFGGGETLLSPSPPKYMDKPVSGFSTILYISMRHRRTVIRRTLDSRTPTVAVVRRRWVLISCPLVTSDSALRRRPSNGFASRTYSRLVLYTHTHTHVRIALLRKSTAMSVDLNTVIPVNGLNDYIAQSPKDDAAAATTALSEQPSLNGVVHASSQSMAIVVSSEDDDDDDDVSAAATDRVPSPIDKTVGSPLDDGGEDNSVEDKKSNIQDVNMDSSLVYEPLADPHEHQQPPPPQQVDPVDLPDSNIAGPSSSSDEVPENEIKQEVVDLGTDPNFYEDNEKKVGYDRGLEADHIVGATEKDGKLMFLIAWKNSVGREADLLEATEVYKKSPQVAIKFFEERLCYINKCN